jgi:hypothetical protein
MYAAFNRSRLNETKCFTLKDVANKVQNKSII